MAINITVGKKDIPVPEEQVDPIDTSIQLNIRRSIDGKYMIFDHGDIDIIVDPTKRKISAFGKDGVENTDVVYDAQNRMFKFLQKRGVIDPESIVGGSVYNSFEAIIPETKSDDINAIQVAIFTIAKFIEEERPYYMFKRAYKKMQDDRLTDPSDEESTELGEVPHKTRKGGIDPGRYPVGGNYLVYEGRIKK